MRLWAGVWRVDIPRQLLDVIQFVIYDIIHEAVQIKHNCST